MYSIEADGISQSLFSSYMMCPMMFRHATEIVEKEGKKLVWRQPITAPLELGTQGHKCLETGKIAFKWDKMTSEETRRLIEAALQAIVPAYQSTYKDKNQHEPEHVFDVKFAGVRLRGKIDDIINRDIVLETKFKNKIDEDAIETRLWMDWQVNFYLLARLVETGRVPTKVIYDVVRYPTLKGSPKKLFEETKKDIAQRPDFWFKRWEMDVDRPMIMAFYQELTQKITEARTRKVWYKNQCACNAGWSACMYLNKCTTGSTDGLIQKDLFSELL